MDNNPNLKHLTIILSKFGNKYVDNNGDLKVANLARDVNHYDKSVMTTLLNDPETNRNYFIPINGIEVFEKNDFLNTINDAKYWNHSYTNYENHIGLGVGKKYINDSSDVVLNFPHKDCVLQGGMTTEENKTNVKENLYNDIISRPQITNMFAPKIFCHAVKYNNSHLTTGIPVANFDPDNDNLMIKANNLIALHSLARRYTGKVKLIYIDPPYNTGNDSFQYNDKFNHSTWLVFMKNRLDIAKQLLAPNGTVVIQTDDNEQAYLKVLMDEIFGRDNYINTISVLTKNIAGASGGGQDKRLKKNIEYLTVYTKSDNSSFNKVYSKKEMSQLLEEYRKKGKSWKYTSVLINPGEPEYICTAYDSRHKPIKIYKRVNYKIMSVSKAQKKYHLTTEQLFSKYGNQIFRTTMPQSSIRPRVMNKYKEVENDSPNLISIVYTPISGKHKGQKYEQFYKGKNFSLLAWLKDVSVVGHDGKLYKTQQLGTFWNMVGSTKNVSHDGGVTFNNGKKPEALLANVIKLTTKPRDTVLDFFAGSATTQAVAMKMKRHFIGIEQMDYMDTISIPRLKNVIRGDQSGISKDANWKGGGSFIYATFLNKNQRFIQLVQNAKTSDNLDEIYQKMKRSADIRLDVNLKKYEAKQNSLPLEEKRRCLLDMLDKNQLYYNYADIDDNNIQNLPALSDNDCKFNKSFYEGGENND